MTLEDLLDPTTTRAKVIMVLGFVFVFISCFLVTRCETEHRVKRELAEQKKDSKLDSLLVVRTMESRLYKLQARQYQDSTWKYKKLVARLDSIKAKKIIHYEKAAASYRTALTHNPDSARRSFLAKRFPDLYPR